MLVLNRRTQGVPFIALVCSAGQASHASSFTSSLVTMPAGKRRWHLRPVVCHMIRACLCSFLVLVASVRAGASGAPAGGSGMRTGGGLEGRVIRMTSLEPEGPGTLRAALEAEGPRLVVFEAGGIIDQRIIDSVRGRDGRIIDGQDEVGGYPTRESTRFELGIIPEGAEARRQWLGRMEHDHS